MDGTQSQRTFYNGFYSKGGWKYNSWWQKRLLNKTIIKPLKLQRGSKILELGCGMGIHSHLLHQLGFKVVGVDVSEIGIDYAKKNFSGPSFFNLDAANLSSEFEYESFDIILIRGMSWYHYELNGENKHGVNVPDCTKDFFRFLAPQGLFILQIKTDFSGSRPADKVHNNKLQDYVDLFSPLGKVIYISDWKGKVINNEKDAEKSKKNIIIATQKA